MGPNEEHMYEVPASRLRQLRGAERDAELMAAGARARVEYDRRNDTAKRVMCRIFNIVLASLLISNVLGWGWEKSAEVATALFLLIYAGNYDAGKASHDG